MVDMPHLVKELPPVLAERKTLIQNRQLLLRHVSVATLREAWLNVALPPYITYDVLAGIYALPHPHRGGF